MTSDREPTRVQVVIIAAGMVLASAMLVWAGWTRHPELHAPPAIAYVVALVFLLAAAMLVLRHLGRDGWLDPLAALLMAGFTGINAWISVGSDERHCTASGPAWLPLPGCRTGFGIAAVFTGGLTWLIVAGWLRRRRRRPGAHPASMG